jgi:hypothetical protein
LLLGLVLSHAPGRTVFGSSSAKQNRCRKIGFGARTREERDDADPFCAAVRWCRDAAGVFSTREQPSIVTRVLCVSKRIRRPLLDEDCRFRPGGERRRDKSSLAKCVSVLQTMTLFQNALPVQFKTEKFSSCSGESVHLREYRSVRQANTPWHIEC